MPKPHDRMSTRGIIFGSVQEIVGGALILLSIYSLVGR